MAELVIRQAEERDIAAIETLEQQCFAVPWTYESLYHDVMHNKLAFYIVAEADGVLCGYVGIWKIVDEGHITNVAVALILGIIVNAVLSGKGTNRSDDGQKENGPSK